MKMIHHRITKKKKKRNIYVRSWYLELMKIKKIIYILSTILHLGLALSSDNFHFVYFRESFPDKYISCREIQNGAPVKQLPFFGLAFLTFSKWNYDYIINFPTIMYMRYMFVLVRCKNIILVKSSRTYQHSSHKWKWTNFNKQDIECKWIETPFRNCWMNEWMNDWMNGLKKVKLVNIANET